MRIAILKQYLKTAFRGSRGCFLTKCVSHKMSLKKKRTDRWHICEGSGSNGKGGDYVINKSHVGVTRSRWARPILPALASLG